MNNTQYALIKIAEEASEVAQAATKALRFGLDSACPVTKITNADKLIDEMGDLCIAVASLEEATGIQVKISEEDWDKKVARLNKFKSISKDLGIIE
jgi:NTP pyrophosphatase (non-canonical NTP hydrolase)